MDIGDAVTAPRRVAAWQTVKRTQTRCLDFLLVFFWYAPIFGFRMWWGSGDTGATGANVSSEGGQGMDAFLLGAGFSKAVSRSMPLTTELGREIAGRLQAQGHDTSAPSELYEGDFEAWLTQLAEGRPWTAEAGALRDRALFLDASSPFWASPTAGLWPL